MKVDKAERALDAVSTLDRLKIIKKYCGVCGTKIDGKKCACQQVGL